MPDRLARFVVVLTCAASILAAASLPARGLSQLQMAQRHRHALDRVITRLHRADRAIRGASKRALRRDAAVLGTGGSRLPAGGHVKTRREAALRHQRNIMHRLTGPARRREHRLHRLTALRRSVTAWIAQWGLLRTCPVRGPNEVTDNFGVIVKIKGVPRHIHQGNDIISPFGTPVVAPFDGNAVAVPNPLGGFAVEVWGPRGYAYNAHLEQYGQLGPVRTGTVVGYVGATGDAGGPHDHFEWHPDNGPAVDPNPYLTVVC